MKLDKFKKRYIFLTIASVGFIIFTYFMKTDDNKFTQQHQEIEQMHTDKDSLYQIADNLIKDIQDKEKKYNSELDSLNQLVNTKGLSNDDRTDLQKEIDRVNWLLEQERNKRKTIETTSVEVKDTVIYNIIEKDSVIYNVVEMDSIVYKDTIIYNEITVDTLIMRKLKFDIDTTKVYSDSIEFKPDF